jgi:hypothetical protein
MLSHCSSLHRFIGQTGQDKALAMLGGLEKVCHETRSLHGSLPLQLVPNPVGCSMISDIPSDRMEGSGSNSRFTYALRYATAMTSAATEAHCAAICIGVDMDSSFCQSLTSHTHSHIGHNLVDSDNVYNFQNRM